MARLLYPAKLTAVVARSGGGKTTFQETMRDALLKAGYDCLWYSPEWSEHETHWRILQRNGGYTTDQLAAHAMYLSNKFRGVMPNPGAPLDRASPVYARTREINRKIKAWPGSLYCFREDQYTEAILDRMRDRLHQLRRDERRVPIAFFDYIQLMRAKEEQPNRTAYETMIGQLKTWSIANAIYVVVGVQILMHTGRQTNNVLGKYDMHYCPPNAFNLIITLNILEDEMGKTNKAIVNVAKNSTGQEGRVQMTTNFRYLAWEDKAWSAGE